MDYLSQAATAKAVELMSGRVALALYCLGSGSVSIIVTLVTAIPLLRWLWPLQRFKMLVVIESS